MAEKHSSKVDTLVIATDDVEVDEKDKKLFLEGTHDYNAHLHLLDVDKATVDQSGSTIYAKAGEGETCIMNTFDGCHDVEVNQDGTFCIAEASGNSRFTAVNYAKDVKNYKQTIKDSVIIVDGTKQKGRKGGINAHTVIGEGTTATINLCNTTTIIRR